MSAYRSRMSDAPLDSSSADPSDDPPPSDLPPESPHAHAVPNRDRMGGLFRGFVIGLLVLGLCVVLPAIGPAILYSRAKARETTCQRNLRDQAAGAIGYYEENGRFHPPSVVTNPDDDARMSWRVGIGSVMPGLEYAAYDQVQGWQSSRNATLYNFTPSVYDCPAFDERTGQGQYVYPTGEGVGFPVLWGAESPTERIAEIGASYRVMIGERVHNLPIWSQPKDTPGAWTPTIDRIPMAEGGNPLFSSGHSKGAQAALFDGSVRMLATRTEPAIIRTLVSPDADGEPLPEEF